MTNLQLLQVRQSECREQINRLLSIDINARSTENDDELNTLTTEAMKLEPAIRAAILASPNPEETIIKTFDPEQRERLALRARAKVGAFVFAALNSQPVGGAEAEYCSAVGCGPLGMIPISVFRPGPPRSPGRHSGC